MIEPVIDADSARALAGSLRDVLKAAERVLGADADSRLLRMITDHIGCQISEIPNVLERWPGWEHANLQRGVDAYLGEHSPDASWFGIGGGSKAHTDLMDMLTMTHSHRTFELGAADYSSVAIAPDQSMEAVQFGLTRTVAPDGTPVVVALRGPAEQGEPICAVQVLAADRATASATRERIVHLMREHDVFRGQILTFGFSEFRGNYLVAFQPRPTMAPDEVVLPPGVLQTIERHVVLAGSRAAVLQQAGQHLKRGLLLHGPPGTGKTHTVRYLLSRLADRLGPVVGRHRVPALVPRDRRHQVGDVRLVVDDEQPHPVVIYQAILRHSRARGETGRAQTASRQVSDRPRNRFSRAGPA